MFVFTPTNQFKRDLKKLNKQSKSNQTLISTFLNQLQKEGVTGVEEKYKAHKLTGNYKDNWEAHTKPDLLIIWFEIINNNEIILIRVGSHSELF